MTAAPMTHATTAQLRLQASLIEAMSGLVDLVARLSEQLAASGTQSACCVTPSQQSRHAEPWCATTGLWEELSVVELRALLRSYPIDRSSLPAPIELLRRHELIEALNQLQALS